MNKVLYDDNWILANWENYRNWNSLCNEYNKLFNTEIKYSTFKAHCNVGLKLNFHYSKEEDAWLIENYPKLGRVKCAEQFNKKFCTNRTAMGIRIHCEKMGLRVSDERKRQRAIENTGRLHDTGTIVEKSHGILFIKKEDGTWTQLSRHLVEEDIPKDCIVIFLDGNKRNLSQDNLAIIPRNHSAIMTKNKFWSEQPEITKTGIIWCELYQELKKQKVLIEPLT